MAEEFEGRDLSGAVFWGVDLSGARLRDADLTGSRTSGGHPRTSQDGGGCSMTRAVALPAGGFDELIVVLVLMDLAAFVRLSEPVYRKLPSAERSVWRKHQPPAVYRFEP